MFQAAIFDMDGLLIDSERAIMRAWIDVTNAAGMPLTEADYLPLVGSSRQHCYDFLHALLGSHAAFEAAMGQVQARLLNASFPLKAGVIDLLDELARQSIPCGVASSSEISEVRRRLAAAGILAYFPVLAGGDEVSCGKPDPAVYLLAAQRLGQEPANCLAFEDSLNGIRAARAAQMNVVVVPDLVAPDIAAAYAVLPTLGHGLTCLATWFNSAGK